MARRGSFAKKIDTVHWTGFSSLLTTAAGTVGINALAAQHLPETLLRIRGEWAAWPSAGLSDAAGARMTAGLILVPEGTDTTVLWSPVTDSDAPWIWWDTIVCAYEEFVTDVVWSSNVLDGRRVIDSKAMRKVRNTELQLVVENETLTGLTAMSLRASVSARVLSGS